MSPVPSIGSDPNSPYGLSLPETPPPAYSIPDDASPLTTDTQMDTTNAGAGKHFANTFSTILYVGRQ